MENFDLTTKGIALGTLAKHGGIVVLGALTHAITAHRSGTSKGFLDFVLLTITSSFSGVMFALFGFYLFDNEYMTMAMAGSGGYLGVEGLSWLVNKVLDIAQRKQ